jgi:hypothetical protein
MQRVVAVKAAKRAMKPPSLAKRVVHKAIADDGMLMSRELPVFASHP